MIVVTGGAGFIGSNLVAALEARKNSALVVCDPAKVDAIRQIAGEAGVRAVETLDAAGKGSLYLRPLLLGSGPILGLGPAPSYTLVVYCAAVGSYFKGGQLTPIDLIVETRFHRSAPGGMGGTKCAGNYSPVLVTQLAAKKEGYADVVYLDAKTDTYLEEVSSCNIFAVKGRTIRTPPLTVQRRQVRTADGLQGLRRLAV